MSFGHSRKQSCRWQVCAGRVQAVSKAETTATCADDDSSTLQVLWHCLEASAEAAIPLGERTMAASHTTACFAGGE